MAIMRKEQKDIDGLGPIGIIGEALKLFSAHAMAFTLIQVTLMIPLAILLYVFQFYILTNLPLLLLRLNRLWPGSVHFPHLAGHFRVLSFNDGGPAEPHFDPTLLVLLLVAAACTIVYQAALSLSQSTTLCCVGLHYAGRPVSFLAALQASTPRVWMRLAITNTCLYVLVFSIPLLEKIGIDLLLHPDVNWYNKWSKAVAGLFVVCVFCLDIIFRIASGVSVLEEDYGWAAMKKSLTLLEGRVLIAIMFQLLCMVPLDIQIRFQWAVFSQVADGARIGFSPWTLTLCSANFVALLAWTTFVWQVQTLCSGVQYVSFKAFHDESLADSIYENRTLEGGYERELTIGDGSNVAPLRGEPPENGV